MKKKKRMRSLEVLSREDGGLTVHSSRISYFLFAGTKRLTETMYAEEGLVWPPGFRALVHDHLAPCTWAQHHGGGKCGVEKRLHGRRGPEIKKGRH